MNRGSSKCCLLKHVIFTHTKSEHTHWPRGPWWLAEAWCSAVLCRSASCWRTKPASAWLSSFALAHVVFLYTLSTFYLFVFTIFCIMRILLMLKPCNKIRWSKYFKCLLTHGQSLAPRELVLLTWQLCCQVINRFWLDHLPPPDSKGLSTETNCTAVVLFVNSRKHYLWHFMSEWDTCYVFLSL